MPNMLDRSFIHHAIMIIHIIIYAQSIIHTWMSNPRRQLPILTRYCFLIKKRRLRTLLLQLQAKTFGCRRSRRFGCRLRAISSSSSSSSAHASSSGRPAWRVPVFSPLPDKTSSNRGVFWGAYLGTPVLAIIFKEELRVTC